MFTASLHVKQIQNILILSSIILSTDNNEWQSLIHTLYLSKGIIQGK